MALKNAQNLYIKLYTNGDALFYKTSQARQQIKDATNWETILIKYEEIIEALESDEERDYYDSEALKQEKIAWHNEFRTYYYDTLHSIKDHHYPLMAQYFPDIEDTIPDIESKINIPLLASDTLEEAYNKAKELKIFGETEDI